MSSSWGAASNPPGVGGPNRAAVTSGTPCAPCHATEGSCHLPTHPRTFRLTCRSQANRIGRSPLTRRISRRESGYRRARSAPGQCCTEGTVGRRATRCSSRARQEGLARTLDDLRLVGESNLGLTQGGAAASGRTMQAAESRRGRTSSADTRTSTGEVPVRRWASKSRTGKFITPWGCWMPLRLFLSVS
jgi:hypothetical protein